MATGEENALEELEIEDTPPQESRLHRILTPGVQLYLAAMFCGSAMKAISKLLVEDMNNYQLICMRMAITGATALIYMWYKSIPHYFWGPPGTRLLLLCRAVMGFLNIALVYYQIQYLSLPNSAIIQFLSPLVTCVAARIFLKEPYYWQQALASVVSFIGVIVIARPHWLFGGYANEDQMASDSIHRMWAVIAGLGNVACSAAIMIVLRIIGDRIHPLASVSSYAVAATSLSFIYLISRLGDVALPRSPRTWALILVSGFSGFFLQFMSSRAVQLEKATVLSPLRYTQLIYATIWEFLIWHDLPDIFSLIGMVFVLAGVIYAAQYKAVKQEKPLSGDEQSQNRQ